MEFIEIDVEIAKDTLRRRVGKSEIKVAGDEMVSTDYRLPSLANAHAADD